MFGFHTCRVPIRVGRKRRTCVRTMRWFAVVRAPFPLAVITVMNPSAVSQFEFRLNIGQTGDSLQREMGKIDFPISEASYDRSCARTLFGRDPFLSFSFPLTLHKWRNAHVSHACLTRREPRLIRRLGTSGGRTTKTSRKKRRGKALEAR